MGQLADVMWGAMAFVAVLGLIAAAAQAWGTDSRPCVGDSHTSHQDRMWI
jgi:hypothetical protein